MSESTACELISWNEVTRLAVRLADMIKTSGFVPETIVAIGRGGYVPARLLCDYLDITALTSIRIEHYQAGTTATDRARIRYPLCSDIAGQRVLVVDDVNDSGDTLALTVDYLRSLQAGEVRVAVLHSKTVSSFTADYYAKRVIKWRWLVYPWALKEVLGQFLEDLSPQPDTIEEARRRIQANYGIAVSARDLQRLNPFLARQLKQR